MKITIEQTSHELLPLGSYVAEISDIHEVTGQYGPQLKFIFCIAEGDFAGQELWGWASSKFSPKSKLYSWTQAAFNTPIPRTYTFDSDDVIGRRVKLTVIVHTGEDGTEYNRISTVSVYHGQPKSDNGSAPLPLFAN